MDSFGEEHQKEEGEVCVCGKGKGRVICGKMLNHLLTHTLQVPCVNVMLVGLVFENR